MGFGVCPGESRDLGRGQLLLGWGQLLRGWGLCRAQMVLGLASSASASARGGRIEGLKEDGRRMEGGLKED